MAAILQRTAAEDGSGEGSGRSRLVVWGLVLALWLAVTLPLALGQRSLFFRDVFGNHLATRSFGAERLAAGEIPAFNPTLGLGLPFRGNPSTLAFYPGNALYLLLPFWSAFNLHFALHWLLALLAMHALARRLGMGREGALLAAATYAGCGWTLSTLSFYNLVPVAAWWPLAMAGAVAGGARGVALGGTACGMALLGGEPLTAALGVVPMLWAAARRHGLRRGLLGTVGVGAVGLLVAAPQAVASLRILGFSFRGTHGSTVEQVRLFALAPIRLLELVIPFPFGWPMDVGPHGWWLGRTGSQVAFFLSLHVGIVALWLALGAVRRRPGWAALAAAGLALAVVLGAVPGWVLGVTGGLFRYPEKLLFWTALALPLLAGWGLEWALSRPSGETRWLRRGGGVAAGLLALAALAVMLAGPGLVARLPDRGLADVAATQVIHWLVYLATAALLLAAGAWTLGRAPAAHRGALLVALQVLALVQLFPLLRTTPTAPFRQAPTWAERLKTETGEAEPAVVNTRIPKPAWEPAPGHGTPPGSRAANQRRNALDLYPAPSVRHGLTYPLAPDIEGLASPLYTFLSVEIARMDWPRRVPWLRTVGVDGVVAYADPGVPGLRLLDRGERQGVTSRLYAVESPAPDAWWPRRVEVAAGPGDALTRVGSLDDPVATVVASRPVDHDPAGTVRSADLAPDRVVLRLDPAGGGLAVVQRSYHTLWRARAGDGRRLDTLPVQLTLLGVVVPPGVAEVMVDVGDGPETAAAVVSLLTLLTVAVLVLRRRAGGQGG